MMTDAELADFLGIANDPGRDRYLASLDAGKRQTYERMKEAWEDLVAHEKGGPMPEGVIVCRPHR